METRIVIRAKAEDAKFIGTSMGGALVIVKDALSGAILSQGMIRGSTGDTKRIMSTPWVRGERLADENTACYVAKLDLEEPKLIEIVIFAPYGQPQAMAKASVTTWVVPGKHIEGDGIVVDFPGLVVRVTEPTAHTFVTVPTKIRLAASVTPMCGCPVDMKTFWPPEAYEVAAYLKKDGEIQEILPLVFCGKRNCFEAEIFLENPGDYEFIVYAFDPKTGNTGVDKTTVVATKS
ncbi:MAG TPA: hypothetical protein ENJ96_00260 [Thermodesulfatator atlanticus]|uniref:Uncharacterized protein n=1 Tax=Thermodesulfatator atlanticus TaxID=501497 RepID=A0A7V5U1N6_9BACT|nr:hypothetical protein [Thermodesulfatator atlanticus]